MQSIHEIPTAESHTVLQPEQARQGKMLGHMRYVLAISLTLVVAAGAVLWFGHF